MAMLWDSGDIIDSVSGTVCCNEYVLRSTTTSLLGQLLEHVN